MGHKEKELTVALKQHGYKLTPQRQAVIRAIANNRDHLTPITIYDKVRQDYTGIGLLLSTVPWRYLTGSGLSVKYTLEVAAGVTW